MRVNVTWEKNVHCLYYPVSVLGGLFFEKIYELFVGTLETVSYIRVSVERGSSVYLAFQLFLDTFQLSLDMCEYS